MKKRHLLTLLTVFLATISARAEWNIDAGKTYYITSSYIADGFLALGSEQGDSHVLYYQTSGERTADAYWVIEESGSGYSIKNNYSGEYLAWSDDYNSLRNLTLSTSVSDDGQRWNLVEVSSGGLMIQNAANTGYYLNLRTSTLYVALYNGSTPDSNQVFHIWDSDGNEVTYSDGTETTDSVEVEIEEEEVEPSPYMDYDTRNLLYLRRVDSTVIVIPQSLLAGDYTWEGGDFSVMLADSSEFHLQRILDVTNTAPSDLPTFTSYKFNNKYNSQVFTDAEATNPGADTISLSVACIGRWLTASFQVADDNTRVWVDGVRQRSKETRQSFASPIVYSLTNPDWQMLKLRLQEDSTYVQELSDYEHLQTVSVSFLTDQSTNDYQVPRIDITLVDSNGASTGSWSSSNWISSKTTYQSATIAIQGGGVFPDMETTDIQIKGRGNSSWSSSYNSKNPYHFKFSTKQKPLGMTAGKHWVLLANKQDNSMTTNAVGMRIANLFATAATNHIVPVELYINGSYRGSYNLTEKVGFSNNSVDIVDETSAAMIEMDTYDEADGTTPDYSNVYQLAAKVKEPDLNDADYTGLLTKDDILGDFNNMMSVVYQGDDEFTRRVDADYLARYLMANEFIFNHELWHPKSVYLYSEDVTNDIDDPDTEADSDASPWVFGPVWDCDWAFGYEGNYSYFVNDAETDYFDFSGNTGGTRAKAFWNALRYNSEQVDSIYYQLWTDFLQYGGVQELTDFCEDYYQFASASFTHNTSNATSNRDRNNNYRTITNNAISWIEKRANYIYSNLTAYPLKAEETDEETDSGLLGDVNSDGAVSAADLTALLNHLTGLENETFVVARADASGDGTVGDGDEDAMTELVWAQAANSNRQLHLPSATILMQAISAAAYPQSFATLGLQLEVQEGSYSGLQFDMQLPTDIELYSVQLPAALDGMTSRSRLLSDGTYRVIIYANGNTVLPDEMVEIGLEVTTADAMEERVYITAATAATSLGEEERLPSASCRLVVNEDATDGLRELKNQKSADSNGTTYDLSGRRVTDSKMKGIYIRDGKKFVK